MAGTFPRPYHTRCCILFPDCRLHRREPPKLGDRQILRIGTDITTRRDVACNVSHTMREYATGLPYECRYSHVMYPVPQTLHATFLRATSPVPTNVVRLCNAVDVACNVSTCNVTRILPILFARVSQRRCMQRLYVWRYPYSANVVRPCIPETLHATSLRVTT